MNPILNFGPAYQDDRGVIQMVVEDTKFSSVSVIISVAGSSRARHWHKQDSHICFVVKGEIEYYERPVNLNIKPEKHIIKAGQLFYTGPYVEHEMVFTQDTEFWCFSSLSRKNADYEQDTTRFSYSLKELYDKSV